MLSEKIAKVGKLSEIGFVKNCLEQKKIKELAIADKEYLGSGLMFLFTRIANLSGIKEEIPQANKNEIKELILMRFSNLSLEQIDYAFKLERFGEYEERTEHYQLFDAVFVSKVLNKFTEWLRKKRMDHNLPIEKPLLLENSISEKEKQDLINQGVIECFDHFKNHECIKMGMIYIYDVLYDMGKLPTDADYKKKMYEQAVEIIRFEETQKKPSSTAEVKLIREVLKEIQEPKSPKAINKAKEMVLLEFFRKLLQDESKVKEFESEFNVQHN